MHLPALVIGIGETGAKTAEELYRLWYQMFLPDALDLSFMVFVPDTVTLDDLPSSAVFRFELSPQEIIDAVSRRAEDNHLFDTWFNVSQWRGRKLIAPYPRMVERLLFAYEMSLRDDSSIVKALLQRFQHENFRASPNIILISDLSESLGGSLVADIANWTRQAVQEVTDFSPTVTAYTVMSNQHPTRTYAALRELLRFQENKSNYPFFYAAGDQKQSLWNSVSKSALFDFWNVYDRQPQIEQVMTAAIFARLQPKMFEHLRDDEVNLHSLAKHISKTVNTESAMIIATPTQTILNHWQRHQALQSLQSLLVPDEDWVSNQHTRFWKEFSGTELFSRWQEPIFQKRMSNVTLHNRVAYMDDLFFPVNLGSLAMDTADLRQPRIDQNAPTRSNQMLDWAEDNLRPLMHLFDVQNPQETAYAEFIAQTRTYHVEQFRGWLYSNTIEQLTLPTSPIGFAPIYALCVQLDKDIQQIIQLLQDFQKSAEQDLRQAQRENQLSAQRAFNDLEYADSKKNKLQKLFPLGKSDVEYAFNSIVFDVQQMVDTVRWVVLLEATRSFFEDAANSLRTEVLYPLQKWFDQLQKLIKRYDSLTLVPIVSNPMVHFLPDSVDDPWITERVDALPPTNWFHWRLQDERLCLQLDGAGASSVFHLEMTHLQARLFESLQGVAMDSLADYQHVWTFPHALKDNMAKNPEADSWLAQLAQKTQQAEKPTIEIDRTSTLLGGGAISQRNRKGYISHPQPEQVDIQPFVESLINHIRSRHHQLADQDQLINPIKTQENMPFAYLYVTRNIQLSLESVTHSKIYQAYQAQKGADHHVFAAEQLAVEVENWLRLQGVNFRGELSPKVVHHLFNRQRVMWFAVACVLQIEALPQPIIPYVTMPKHYDNAEAVLDALNAFSLHPLAVHDVQTLFEERRDALDFPDDLAADLKQAYDVARRPTTPETTRLQMYTHIATCYLLDRYLMTFIAVQKPEQRQDNVLLFDTYVTFEYLLKQQRKTYHDQLINQQIALSG